MKPHKQYITLHAASLRLGWTVYRTLRRALEGDFQIRRVNKHLFVRVADVERIRRASDA